MRVLIANRGVVALRPGCGGAEHAAYQLARHIARTGSDVTFLSDIDQPLPATAGLEIVPLNGRMVRLVRRLPASFFLWVLQHLVGNISTVLAVRRLIRARGPFDVVHVHGNLAGALVPLFAHAPVVYTEHDATPWSCRYRRWWERAIRKVVYRVVNGLAYRLATRVVPVYDALGDEIVERWHIDPAKVVSITNGTDVDLFHPEREGVSLVRQHAGFDNYCLFIGSLTTRKAPDLLVRAVADSEGLNCAIVGEGPMRKKLEVLAHRLGVGDRVAFLGAVAPDLLGRIYADADFLVLPSVSEGTPLVLAESLACGTPVITTAIAGSPTIVRDDETGFLIPPGDVGALTTAVQALAADRHLRERLGRAGHQLVRSHFVWPVLARKYTALYADLAALAEKPPAVAAVASLV